MVEAYGCSLVEGVLSHQLKRFIIDGNKVVLNRSLPDLKAEDAQFEENEVYGIDILVSSGEGKARVTDERETTVCFCLVSSCGLSQGSISQGDEVPPKPVTSESTMLTWWGPMERARLE